MGMFSFIKEAGEKLFGVGKAQAAPVAASAAPSTDEMAALNKYPQIFEANKPMLTHLIYPGQVLCIPTA